MMIQVDSDLCAGCGVCMQVCRVEAIHLLDQRVVIDAGSCTQCEACVNACPNGAIASIPIPFHNSPAMALATTQTGMIPASTKTVLPEVVHPNRSLAPVAGAALAFLGSEVAPRMLDLLITTLERRLARPETNVMTPLFPPSPSMARRGRGTRRQIRHRGGRAANGNQKKGGEDYAR